MKDVLPFIAAIGTIVGVVAYLMYALMRRGGPRSRGPGAGASGAVYDMLNEDKRKAIEIILEERTGYVDPETADDGEKPGLGQKSKVIGHRS